MHTRNLLPFLINSYHCKALLSFSGASRHSNPHRDDDDDNNVPSSSDDTSNLRVTNSMFSFGARSSPAPEDDLVGVQTTNDDCIVVTRQLQFTMRCSTVVDWFPQCSEHLCTDIGSRAVFQGCTSWLQRQVACTAAG